MSQNFFLLSTKVQESSSIHMNQNESKCLVVKWKSPRMLINQYEPKVQECLSTHMNQNESKYLLVECESPRKLINPYEPK